MKNKPTNKENTMGLKPLNNVIGLKKKTTYVCFVLDNSASMGSIKENIRALYNQQVDKQIEASKLEDIGEIYCSLFLFGSQVTKIFENQPVNNLCHLKPRDYLPSEGATAMYDGIGTAILSLASKESFKEDEDVAFLVITLTDGQNNTSIKWTPNSLAERVKALEARGNWTFVTIGAEIDLTKTLSEIGLKQSNSKVYAKSHAGGQAMLSDLGQASATYFVSRSQNIKVDEFFDKTSK